MSPDEHRLLTTFLDQLNQVGGITKDPQAAALIAESAARQPDATYLLVQRALLQDQALNAARERIENLEAQLRTASAASATSSGSFLDSGNNAWGRSVGAASTQARAVAPLQFAPPQAAAAQPVAAASPGFLGGGGGSFLTSMAATAAGVAGGAFLYQGISNMMHPGGASHAMGQGANPFGGMANSVDHAATTPAVETPSAALDDSNYQDVASDDSSAGSDDSYA